VVILVENQEARFLFNGVLWSGDEFIIPFFAAFFLNWMCGNCCWKPTSQVFFWWGVLKIGFCKVDMSSWRRDYYLSYNNSTLMIYVIFRYLPCLSHLEYPCIFLPTKVNYADTLLSCFFFFFFFFFWSNVIFLFFTVYDNFPCKGRNVFN